MRDLAVNLMTMFTTNYLSQNSMDTSSVRPLLGKTFLLGLPSFFSKIFGGQSLPIVVISLILCSNLRGQNRIIGPEEWATHRAEEKSV
jgi:hypothetical protein